MINFIIAISFVCSFGMYTASAMEAVQEASAAASKQWVLHADEKTGIVYKLTTGCKYNLSLSIDGVLMAIDTRISKNDPKEKLLSRQSNSGSGVSVIDIHFKERNFRLIKGQMNDLVSGDSIFISSEDRIMYYDRSKKPAMGYDLGIAPTTIS